MNEKPFSTIYNKKNIMKIRFSFFLLMISISVSIIGAGFSIFGLAKLFSGAATAVIIMASGLEIAKIVTTTALHRYWNKTTNLLKFYLTISVLVLMFITSVGIYGFLSNAYQKTANKLEIENTKIGILTTKKEYFSKTILDNQKIIDQKNKRINQLTELRLNQESRLDGAKNNRTRNSFRSDINLANDEIQKLTSDIDQLTLKNTYLGDSITKYSVNALEITSNSEAISEVGPLKYISELTSTPMGKVVNIIILLLVFVFDPLAVALILMTNRAFEIEKEEEIETITKKDNEPVIEEPVVEEPVIEEPVIEEPVVERKPVIPTGKIEYENIKEIRDRGFSVNVPPAKHNNSIERVGSNKFIKNGDNTMYFKRN